MLYRTLGSTGVSVSVIELGTWQPGGEWGRTFNPGKVRAIFNAVRESVEAPWLKRDTLEDLRVFYDSVLIDIHKAPSLGSDETLPCPYTLLTHYTSSGEELADIGPCSLIPRLCRVDLLRRHTVISFGVRSRPRG